MTTISAGLPQNVLSPSATANTGAQMQAGKTVLPAPLADTSPLAGSTMSPAGLLIKDAVARLASQQNGAALLFADLEVAAERTDLPQAVRVAAQAVLSLRVGALKADALKNAVLRSGLFTEAMLASGNAPTGDMKLALLSLRQTLQGWLGTSGSERAPATSLPPPHRGAVPIAQQPALPSIAMLDARAAGLHLLAETDGALARQTLLQIASVSDAIGRQPQTDAPVKLTLDIPIATPLGTAIVQLQVEQDDARQQDGEGKSDRTWRINLAIDVEPLGPVRATVSQVSGQTHVALLAERKDSAQALRDDLPALQSALAEAALDVGDLQCRTGRPQGSPAPAGLFVDRAS